MKSYPSLFALTSVVTVLGQLPAWAEEIALSFELPAARPTPAATSTAKTPDLPPSRALEKASAPSDGNPSTASTDSGPTPLPIPDQAASPPTRTGQTLPNNVYSGMKAIRQADNAELAAYLPPPPPLAAPLLRLVAHAEPPPELPAFNPEPVALAFEIAPSWVRTREAQPVANAEPSPPLPVTLSLNSIFEGGSDSLVARIVGSAEGTRTASGDRTAAYYGHQDPGNGVWNMGTFSYQHGAQTPEEADRKQLERLQSQTQFLVKRAEKRGIELSPEEMLNGIDLANQSPLAALGKVGYIEWLTESRKLGMGGQEAIVWARTRSYLDPDTQRWNAPGLGNNVHSITHDQERRMLAIARAFEAYQAQSGVVGAIAPAAPRTPVPIAAPAPSPQAVLEAQVDTVILTFWDDDSPTLQTNGGDPAPDSSPSTTARQTEEAPAELADSLTATAAADTAPTPAAPTLTPASAPASAQTALATPAPSPSSTAPRSPSPLASAEANFWGEVSETDVTPTSARESTQGSQSAETTPEAPDREVSMRVELAPTDPKSAQATPQGMIEALETVPGALPTFEQYEPEPTPSPLPLGGSPATPLAQTTSTADPASSSLTPKPEQPTKADLFSALKVFPLGDPPEVLRLLSTDAAPNVEGF